jgi:hypothetical protein
LVLFSRLGANTYRPTGGMARLISPKEQFGHNGTKIRNLPYGNTPEAGGRVAALVANRLRNMTYFSASIESAVPAVTEARWSAR